MMNGREGRRGLYHSLTIVEISTIFLVFLARLFSFMLSRTMNLCGSVVIVSDIGLDDALKTVTMLITVHARDGHSINPALHR